MAAHSGQATEKTCSDQRRDSQSLAPEQEWDWTADILDTSVTALLTSWNTFWYVLKYTFLSEHFWFFVFIPPPFTKKGGLEWYGDCVIRAKVKKHMVVHNYIAYFRS